MADYNWNLETTIDDSNFPADTLDRAKYAEFLTRYLSTIGKENNYVLNLNSEWGTGKTYFIRRWSEEVKNNHPVVYIDAWSQDFSEDPLLTVVASIITELEDQANIKDAIKSEIQQQALKFLKISAPIVMKGLVKKLTGTNYDDISQEMSKSDDNDEDSSSAIPDIAQKFAESLIADHSDKVSSIKEFKKSIHSWIDKICQTTDKNFPAFIFIDELDRCRPSYAIEMLETIKHLFKIEHIVFVIATDTHQLQHSIRVIYGNEFDAEGYLGRFFNRRITLSPPTHDTFIQNLEQYSILFDKLNTWRVLPYSLEEEDYLNFFAQLFGHYNLSLRTTERIIDQSIAILLEVEDKQIGIDLYLLTYLLCLKEVDYKYYSRLKKKDTPLGIQVLATREPETFKKHSVNFMVSYTYPTDYFQFINNNANFTNETQTETDTINLNNYFQIKEKYQTNPRKISDEFQNLRNMRSVVLSSEDLRIFILKTHNDYPEISFEHYFDLIDLANLFDA